MFKKEFFILFLLVSSFINAQTEIKVNLASALLLVPNIGIEVQLSEKLGYQLDTSASFFDNIEGSPFQTIQIFNELRYYPKLKEGRNKRSFFIGPHVGYGMFTLKIPRFITSIVDTELKEEGSYQSGRNAYYGITIGKKTPNNLQKGFAIRHTPTFIFFRDGKEIGRFVEHSKKTIEKDILKILRGGNYKHPYQK